MLSESFTNWVATLDATERVLTPVKRMSLTERFHAAGYIVKPKRNESLQEFFANRSSK